MHTFEASTRGEWRQWLADNGQSAKEVWLVVHKKASVGYLEAVEDALCFGWIDSKSVKRDEQSRYQRFTPRNPRSGWSKVNRERVARLTEAGLMTQAGQAAVDHAKQTGAWTVFVEAENLVVPDDLQRSLDGDAAALRNFSAFPPSSRKRILGWITTAKRPETRARRIARTVELAAKNLRANHPGVR